jgi:hypothetical protein
VAGHPKASVHMPFRDWFLAQEEEAAALTSILTTAEHSSDEWPHLEMPLIEMDLMELSALVRGNDDLAAEPILEDPLFWHDAGVCVTRVKDAFIQALAQVKPEDQPSFFHAWAYQLDRQQHEPEQLRELLATLVRFAREAVARGSPVLELSTF